MALRTQKKYANDISLQDPISSDSDGNMMSLQDVLESDEEDIVEQVDLKFKVKSLYDDIKKVLKKREQLVIQMRYGLACDNEKTQREIADILGISRSYVSRIEKKALKKLYNELKDI